MTTTTKRELGPTATKRALTEAGWTRSNSGFWQKAGVENEWGGKLLHFSKAATHEGITVVPEDLTPEQERDW